MTVYVDGREDEQHKWVKQLLNIGIDAKSGQLPVDFMWTCPQGLVLVERKTWKDFADSFKGQGGVDGGNRLVGQLLEGPKGAALKVLLLEGKIPQYVQLGGMILPIETIDDALVSMQWQFGIIIIHSYDHEHTPSRLAAFFKYTQKGDHNSLIRPVPPATHEKIYMNPDFRRKIAAMICTPMIGEKAALQLPDISDSPKDAMNLTVQELMKLPGWGKGRAERFIEFWGKW